MTTTEKGKAWILDHWVEKAVYVVGWLTITVWILLYAYGFYLGYTGQG